MTGQPPRQPPEQPRSEPEIIPPGATHDPMRPGPFFDTGRGPHIYVAKVGPFGVILIALVIGLVVALVLVLLLGAFLLWIPIVGLLLAAGLISAAYRKYIRRDG